MRRRPRVRDQRDRVREAFAGYRFQQVATRPRLKCRNGVRVVGGDENDHRRIGEPPQQAREFEPVESGHQDVEEDPVIAIGLQPSYRFGGIRGDVDGCHRRLPVQQELQISTRRRFVIDDQDPQAARGRLGWVTRCRCGHEARTPARYFGIRTMILVPAPSAVSTVIPWSAPNTCRNRSSTLTRPTPWSLPAGELVAHELRIHAHAVVLDAQNALDVAVLRGDRHVADAFLVLQTVPDRVLHQRLDEQARYRDREHFRGNPEHDLKAVAEPGALEFEIGVDRLQLVGDRRELTTIAEAVPDEVGEAEQQVACPVRDQSA